MQAVFNRQVIASSENTILVEGGRFPPDFDGCPGRDVYWAYRHPSPPTSLINNHIAFRRPVRLVDNT